MNRAPPGAPGFLSMDSALVSLRSRVHPKYKTRYRVRNWATCDRALAARGDITLWLSPEAVAGWKSQPTGHRGGQGKFSGLAIPTCLTLRAILRLPLRQTGGFVRSILRLAGLDLEAPGHSTLSRRGTGIEPVLLRPQQAGPVHVIVDSTGLSVSGQGQRASAKHGERGRRGWVKIHFCVDRRGNILAREAAPSTGDDAATAIGITGGLDGESSSVTGDRAYDTRRLSEAAGRRGARVVVPPVKNASPDGPGMDGRDGTIRRVRETGARRWKRESGCHMQGRAENTVFRYKSAFGDRIRSRSLRAQRAEAAIACNALARMTGLGMPDSYPVKP